MLAGMTDIHGEIRCSGLGLSSHDVTDLLEEPNESVEMVTVGRVALEERLKLNQYGAKRLRFLGNHQVGERVLRLSRQPRERLQRTPSKLETLDQRTDRLEPLDGFDVP